MREHFQGHIMRNYMQLLGEECCPQVTASEGKVIQSSSSLELNSADSMDVFRRDSSRAYRKGHSKSTAISLCETDQGIQSHWA